MAADLATGILTAAGNAEFSLLDSVSDHELQIARNGDSIKSLQLENDLLSKTVEGFGTVVVANGTAVVCQTVTNDRGVHEALIAENTDRLQLELKSEPTILTTSIESAFVSAKRGQCGAIYGAAKDLRDLILSLQRDKLNYHVVPIWFSPDEVDVKRKKVADREASDLRAQRAVEQKKLDDQLRRDIEKKQTDAEEKQHEGELRQQNGPVARGMAESVLSRIRSFSSENTVGGGRVAQEWPTFASWFQEQKREEWELESVSGDLEDYGIVEWKNRVLEAAFVQVRFKMKQRVLGEYQEKCFSLGYTADREFDVERDPIAVACEDVSSINRYKVAHNFTSKWFVR